MSFEWARIDLPAPQGYSPQAAPSVKLACHKGWKKKKKKKERGKKGIRDERENE